MDEGLVGGTCVRSLETRFMIKSTVLERRYFNDDEGQSLLDRSNIKYESKCVLFIVPPFKHYRRII